MRDRIQRHLNLVPSEPEDQNTTEKEPEKGSFLYEVGRGRVALTGLALGLAAVAVTDTAWPELIPNLLYELASK